MSDDTALDELRQRAKAALARLGGMSDEQDLAAAKALVEQLRNAREYEFMGGLAEAVSRLDPDDARNRRLYAQYLIDTGKATAAIDLLRPLAKRLARDHPEHAEATGLLGRAYKQIFFDAGDKTSKGALAALKDAIDAYRHPYEDNPANTWHGVNLVALLTRARRLGLRVAPTLQPRDVASRVIATLEATPPSKRDEWFPVSLAEASLGLGDWDAVERNVRAYVATPEAKAFQVASTLRQFTQVWDLEAVDDRGRGLVNILRARLLALPGGGMEVGADELQRLRRQASPESGQLEAVLGSEGPQTYRWWKTGLDRALSVGGVRQKLGSRIGTAFLVRASDLGLEPGGELLALTNFHVVNEHGASPGIRPEEAEVVFEAVDPDRAFSVKALLWSSPPDRHDASLLRLEPAVTGIAPLPIAKALPVVEATARVYVIGHPGGRELAFSFQDNELLDHEGPPAGQPQIPEVCRLHYRAPTEGGSSGSPVFNARLWEVIALHHKGGKLGMPKLNGKDGTYAANEGISIRSIRAALTASHRDKSAPTSAPPVSPPGGSASEATPPGPESVLLGVSAPRQVGRGGVFSARFVAYVEALEERVRRQLKELDGDEAKSALGIPPERTARWKVGTPVTVRLEAGPNISVRPKEASFEWSGQHNLVSFSLTVAPDAPAAPTQLCFEAFIEGLPIAFIPLDVAIAHMTEPSRATASAHSPATAFASYSSLDAQAVTLCLSALSRWDPGLKVFMDCLDLKPNERWRKELERVIPEQDVFFLFWSANAMKSKWVDWEWRHVSAKKGIDAIRPFPLDDPAIAPPPLELQHLHFRDRYMLAREALVRVAERRA